MESLAALSLAASIVQFVDFTKKLLLDARDIYRSGKGALDDNLELGEICEILKRLSGELIAGENSSTAAGKSTRHLVPTTDALGLETIASSCKKDCDELLSILQDLSVDNGANRRWRSIKASVRNFQHKGKIKELEDRITKAQNIMSLHIQSVIRSQVAGLSEIAMSLKEKNETFQLSQDEKLDRITRDIHSLSICGGYKDFSLPNIEWAANRLSECLPQQDELTRLQRILTTLQFQTRPVRHNSIPEAHVSTFRWIFKSKFSKWLRDGDGIFWISGKAGSGKSTMMKFIADHEITYEIANKWAAPKPVVIACHYFWNTGTEMQRSQQGLLQSILFDIFRQCSTLVPLVCPKRWEAAHRVDSDPDATWTVTELSACLQQIAHQQDSTVRFCLIIDGLDEFSGDYVDLCQSLQSLSKSRHIKLCVSSRPWNVFQDFFGQDLNTVLPIHELTRDDIRRFAQNRLETHPRWKITYMNEEYQHELVEEIADRAEGVFLWAFLVTQSFREGLSNDDTMIDLQRRLRSLPTDLERLFKSLLNGVDPVYYERMAGIIQIARFAKEPLNLCLYYHHDKQSEWEDYAYSQVQGLQADEYAKALELTRRRINSRTRGLLEVVSLSEANERLSNPQCVQFLHRTVRDFLMTREMDDFLSEKSIEHFDPALEICKASLAWIKCESRVLVMASPNILEDMLELHDMLRYATEVTAGKEDTLVKVLDDLESSIVEMSHGFADTAHVPRIAFRRLILWHNLSPYISAKLSLNPTHFDIFDIPALSVVWEFPQSDLSRNPPPPWPRDHLPVDSVKALLEHGHNPNEFIVKLSSTPWCEFTRDKFTCRRGGGDFLIGDLTKTFLRHGADPNGTWTPGFSVFGLFLLTCFSLSWPDVPSQMTYLNMLQDFLDSGADLDYQLHVGYTNFCFGLPHMEDLTGESICDVFSRLLKSRAGKWKVHDQRDQKERHFLSAITRKLLSPGVLCNHNMAMLIEAVPSVFPENLAEELLAASRKTGGPCSSKKRNEESRDLGVKGQKRRKLQ
ncbi:hypothetical protein F4859DRAFT_472902 [Xylaria cf. heliscus]|nr:hypothetical protein F4859DRAFT_472902 [Xylaria cf. heliscus]